MKNELQKLRYLVPADDQLLWDQVDADFIVHYQELARWNQVHNLTRIIEPSHAATHHYLDCFLASLLMRPLLSGAVVDIGSGAGFPGWVLGIMYPELAVVLSERVAKKSSFLERVSFRYDNLSVSREDGTQIEADFYVTRATRVALEMEKPIVWMCSALQDEEGQTKEYLIANEKRILAFRNFPI